MEQHQATEHPKPLDWKLPALAWSLVSLLSALFIDFLSWVKGHPFEGVGMLIRRTVVFGVTGILYGLFVSWRSQRVQPAKTRSRANPTLRIILFCGLMVGLAALAWILT